MCVHKTLWAYFSKDDNSCLLRTRMYRKYIRYKRILLLFTSLCFDILILCFESDYINIVKFIECCKDVEKFKKTLAK